MATKKKSADTDSAEMAEAAEPATPTGPTVDTPQASRQAPPATVIGNSTFADRAKARNKRVDKNDASGK